MTVHNDEVGIFENLASRDKDPRKSLHVKRRRAAGLGPMRPTLRNS
jgi:crotonyl-CoA reductase